MDLEVRNTEVWRTEGWQEVGRGHRGGRDKIVLEEGCLIQPAWKRKAWRPE